MALNARMVALDAVKAWKATNPRGSRETLRQYRARARKEISSELVETYGASPWLTILLQFLPLLLELFLK